MNFLTFMMSLGSVTSELNRLLKIRFVPDSKSKGSHLDKTLSSLIPLWNQGRKMESELELLRLIYLVKHLKEIEGFRPELLSHFRRELRRTGNPDSYFGVRFEVYIAASLIRGKVDFIKHEAPDFLIKNGEIGLECTSVRIQNYLNKKDYSYKVKSAVRKKTKSKSNRPEVALIIDVTNIAYSEKSPDIQRLRQTASDALATSEFGSVVLFIHMFNHQLKRIESNYIRSDSEGILAELKQTLDLLYPFGKHRVSSFVIPKEG